MTGGFYELHVVNIRYKMVEDVKYELHVVSLLYNHLWMAACCHSFWFYIPVLKSWIPFTPPPTPLTIPHSHSTPPPTPLPLLLTPPPLHTYLPPAHLLPFCGVLVTDVAKGVLPLVKTISHVSLFLLSKVVLYLYLTTYLEAAFLLFFNFVSNVCSIYPNTYSAKLHVNLLFSEGK